MLNDRQKVYLETLFDLDQQAEADEKQERVRTGHSRPAAAWRWIEYGPGELPEAYNYDPALRHKLRQAGLVDQGAGSTWKALFDRGLIKIKYDRRKMGPHSYSVMFVQMTRQGRALVREMRDIKKGGAKPLSIGAWRVLVYAYRKGGVVSIYDAWHDEDKRPPHPLVISGIGKSLLKQGLVMGKQWEYVEITAEGKAFVESERGRYAALYPRVG